MEQFLQRIKSHIEHVKNVGGHCSTEETTKQALILPLLDILGFSPYDPTKVKAEYAADFPGAKNNERVDYALFCQGIPVMLIEAKAFGEKLNNHAPQLSRYFNATPEVAVSAITNGREWRFFTDLANKNVMDDKPFLTIDFDRGDVEDAAQLARFHHDKFRPEAMRTLAEENIYLSAFKSVISQSLREVDPEFVRFVAARSNVQRQLNQKFLDSITPLVKQAVERAVSEMVLTGLSAATTEPVPVKEIQVDCVVADDADWVNPDNPRIVTTAIERKLFSVAEDILGVDSEIVAKDTESYYSILFQGKNNRWLLRYYGDKKQPTVQFPFALTSQQLNEVTRAGLTVAANGSINLDKPEHLHRLTGVLFDALAYCKNNDNFKRQNSAE